jgi:hypothetical protein
MIRLEEAQKGHDTEVCRLAKKYTEHEIWSPCPNVTNKVELPKLPYDGTNYEPDVYLKQVRPEAPPETKPEPKPIDWLFEIETATTIGIEHTEKQLRAFAKYSMEIAAKVIVLVPGEAIEEMKKNLVKWKLNDVVEIVEWGWPDTGTKKQS